MAHDDRLDPAPFTQTDFPRVTAAEIAAASALGSATLHEAAGKIGALTSAIKPMAPGFRISGAAMPVLSPPGDNLWLHRAIYAAKPGDILVVHVNAAHEHGYWGEVMSTAAQVRGLAGMVIDGCVRDADLLAEIGFPVFARGLCIRGTGKDFTAHGHIGSPTWFGDIRVLPGDLIVGDADGVVCIPRAMASRVIAAGQERERYEADICRQLRQGASTLDLFGWQ